MSRRTRLRGARASAMSDEPHPTAVGESRVEMRSPAPIPRRGAAVHAISLSGTMLAQTLRRGVGRHVVHHQRLCRRLARRTLHRERTTPPRGRTAPSLHSQSNCGTPPSMPPKAFARNAREPAVAQCAAPAPLRRRALWGFSYMSITTAAVRTLRALCDEPHTCGKKKWDTVSVSVFLIGGGFTAARRGSLRRKKGGRERRTRG